MSTIAGLPVMGGSAQDASVQPRPQPSAYLLSMTSRIRLPAAPSLYPSLIAIGAEERVAKEMECAYYTRVLEFQSYLEKSINVAFAASVDPPLPRDSEKKILEAFANFYLSKVKSWIEDGVVVYKSTRKARKQVVNTAEVPGSANPRRAFNAVCPTFFSLRCWVTNVVLGLCSPSRTFL